MLSIQYLFEDIENSSIPKKYKKRISRKCKIFKGFEDNIPDFSYPEVNTKKFEEDLNEVRRCVREPSLTKSFLKLSDKNSENIFKNYVKDEDFDWKALKPALKEFDGIMLRQKFKYDRKRPFEYFEENGEDIKTEKAGSPSFPSGHTAFAYFLCDILSHHFPNRQMEFQTLAEMIGQSRIENGVHFPSDISAGRFLGEQAAKFVNSKNLIQENIIDKKAHKTFVRFLRKRSQDCRPNFSKFDALNYYANDMSVFLSESLDINIDECLDASKSMLAGYKIEECSDRKEIQRFLEGMCQAFFHSQSKILDIVNLNKILESKSSLRKEEKMTISGITYSPVSKISEFSSKIEKFNNKPFLKLAAVNWIAPFESGNKKITNIIFLKETGFNFDIANQILCDNLPELLESFYLENDMEKLFS